MERRGVGATTTGKRCGSATIARPRRWYAGCASGSPHALEGAPMNAAQLLWRTAARCPDHPAVVEDGRTCTYATLLARADAVTMLLRQEGIERGDRVGIFLERGADAIAAFFGVLAAGAVAVTV